MFRREPCAPRAPAVKRPATDPLTGLGTAGRWSRISAHDRGPRLGSTSSCSSTSTGSRRTTTASVTPPATPCSRRSAQRLQRGGDRGRRATGSAATNSASSSRRGAGGEPIAAASAALSEQGDGLCDRQLVGCRRSCPRRRRTRSRRSASQTAACTSRRAAGPARPSGRRGTCCCGRCRSARRDRRPPARASPRSRSRSGAHRPRPGAARRDRPCLGAPRHRQDRRPGRVLRKRGPLNSAEWTLMRNHTLIGERILSSAPAMAPVARIVRSTHERWDGAGYPDSLAGEEIPLGARVIAVCDAFVAMTQPPALARDQLRMRRRWRAAPVRGHPVRPGARASVLRLRASRPRDGLRSGRLPGEPEARAVDLAQ